MKLIYLCILIITVISCNNSTGDSKALDEIDIKDEFEVAEHSMDSLFSAQKEVIEPFIDGYTPKEVFFEILHRESYSKSDTMRKDTLPLDVQFSYTKEELAYLKQKNIPLQALTNIQLLTLYNEVLGGRKVIYGADDRLPVIYDTSNIVPVNDETNPFMEDGKCVVAMIPKASLSLISSTGQYKFHPIGTFKSVYSLCETEKFLLDPVVANCSGFGASGDKIVTAGHCINQSNYRGFYFVFDFKVDSSGKLPERIPASSVFEAIEFIAGQESGGDDFAVVRVNKPITGRRIAKLNYNPSYNAGSLFHVIGCPCGTPLKLATNANLRANTNPKFFQITSDTYGGNSGSPVFNSDTHMVEGILVRGNTDFQSARVQLGNCRVSVVCAVNECRGEDVSKNSQFLRYIQ